MKKLSAIILTFIFLMSMLVPTTVGATFSEENITVGVIGYTMTVTVTADTEGTMVAHLVNEAKDHTYGLDYDEAPVENNGVYTYTFTFEMDKTISTSKLYIKVGNVVPTTEKLINYANINDKNAFFNGLEAVTDAELVDEYLGTNSAYTSVDVAGYLDLSEDVRTMVSDIIVDLDLATGYTNSDSETDEYLAQKTVAVTEKETIFNTAFAEAMKYAALVDATEEEWATLAPAAITEGLFDDEYYTANDTVPATLNVADAYAFFGVEADAMETLTETEIKKAFDRATLMAVESKAEYGTLKAAFLYFENKGTITVSDMTDIDALVSAGKDVDLWKNLKAGTYADCGALVAAAVTTADTMVANGALNSDTAGDGITGGSINRPSSPGGFTGGSLGGGGNGGASAPTTPSEPVTPVTPAGTFSDIASVEWAKESIEALAEMGVLNGKGDGKFAPNDKVTREEFVKIIVAAFELSDDEAACDFNDVAKDSWSYPYIAAANKLGIVSGDGASFNPTSGISRQDMAVIIHRVFEHLGLEVSGDAISFDDGADIAGYAKDAVEALTAAGIINGMGDGTFAPAGTVTRAQAAKVVYGLLNLVGGGK